MDMSEEFQESYNEFLFRKADALNLPIMGTFELTPVCNMSCRMCYIQQNLKSVNEKGGLKNISFWDSIFDQAVDAGMLFCLLTGGEIFTYPDFRELYERLYRKGVHIVLNTNGTLLNEDIVSWLAQIPPRRLNISLYGASCNTYAKLCHHSNGFSSVVRSFELLNQYKIPFRVHGVLVPVNSGDYEEIKDICNHFRAPLELSYYMFPPFRKEQGFLKAGERFSPVEMANIALSYRRDQCGGETDRWLQFLEEKCYHMEHPELIKTYGVNRITCRSGSSVFWVNWKGEVSGCGMDDNNSYDLEKISFKEAWNNIGSCNRVTCISEKCAFCEYREICPVCAAAAYCETGRIDGTPEYLCEFSKEYSTLLKQEWRRLKSNVQ